VGGAPGVLATAKRKNRTRSYINGSTANLRKRGTLFFLRKLRSSYGILTDERNSYVGLLLQRTTEIRQRRNEYVMLETMHESITITIIWNGHCACAVSRDLSPGQGSKMIHIFEIHDHNLSIHFVCS